MAQEKISISARMGTVMGVERGIPNKLAIDANAKSWHQLPRKMREELLKEAKFQTRRIKKKTR